MKVELKKVQHFAAGSQETECFVAELWIDGKNYGRVENDGHGGSHMYASHAAYELLCSKATDRWGDSFVDTALEVALISKRLKAKLAKRVMYLDPKDGRLSEYNPMPPERRLILQDSLTTQNKIVLNDLPLEHAVDVFLCFAAVA